jgi:hypothetical protein
MNPARNPKIRTKPGFWAILPLGLTLVGCFKDDGVIFPDQEGLTPLASISGKAANEGDTALSAKRWLQLGKPKITLVWQFVGPKAYGEVFEKSSVDVSAPFAFSVEIRNPPPPEVLASQEPVIASFWLYADRNGNGRLDRIVHPELRTLNGKVDSLREIYERKAAEFKEASVALESRIPVTDTFYLESTGTLIHAAGGRFDTLFMGKSPEDAGTYQEIIFRRYRLLKDFNGWENFFALRKKAHDYSMSSTPVIGHALRLVYQDWCKRFPIPGQESRFESALMAATQAALNYNIALYQSVGAGVRKGWADYPYAGFDSSGQDWVAGKSRWYHLIYLPDQASLNSLLEAERGGSFRIDNVGGLRRGYNLTFCDEQYRCRILSSRDSILIDLGETNAYFDPLSKPIEPMMKDYTPVPIGPAALKVLEGEYRYKPFHSITILSRYGDLWGDIPDYGLHRLTPVDSLRFFAPGSELQLEFVASEKGVIEKLLLFRNQERAVVIKMDTLGQGEATARKVDSVYSQPRGRLPPSLLSHLPPAFDYRKDSALVKWSEAGDSAMVAIPRLPGQTFYPMNDSQLSSRSSQDRLTLRRNGMGTINGISYATFAGEFFLPAFGYKPRLPADLFSDTLPRSRLVSAGDGTGRDTYVNLGGSHRYACSEDGLFLRSGDGWIARMGAGGGGDSISMGIGGVPSLVFRIAGLEGKSVKLELRICQEKSGKPGRILFSLRGGAAEDRRQDLIAENHWVNPLEKGASLSWEPIFIPSDPYYLGLDQTATADAPFFYSFDHYRIYSD